MTTPNLGSLSDEELMLRVDDVLAKNRHSTAEFLRLLIEIDERRLHLRGAYPSLFEYCVRRCRMSEGKAYRHITAARLARDCPKLLTYIENGDIHLSRIAQLRHLLKPENVDELVEATRGMSKYEVEELVRRRDPRPDVPGRMRKLPTLRTDTEVAPAMKPRIEPHAESRYRLQATISRELRDKIERALDLMSHGNPKRDLTMLLERAVDALLEKIEKQRLAKTLRPESSTPATKKRERKGGPSNATRRRVFKRDGERCTYEDEHGRRCSSRKFLELDHIIPRAQGGTDDDDNLRVRCRPHNGLHAEDSFGKSHVRSKIESRRRVAGARAKAA